MKYPEMTWGRMQAVIDRLGGEEGVNNLLSGRSEVVVRPYLEKVAVVRMGPRPEFNVMDHLVRKVKDKFMYSGTHAFFPNPRRPVEPATGEVAIRVSRLWERTSVDKILRDLGEQAHVSFSHLWGVLEQQPRSDSEGPLVTDGHTNIAFIQGVECVVCVAWERSEGWWIFPGDRVGYGEYPAGTMVLSLD